VQYIVRGARSYEYVAFPERAEILLLVLYYAYAPADTLRAVARAFKQYVARDMRLKRIRRAGGMLGASGYDDDVAL
jgi:hypothetical protein